MAILGDIRKKTWLLVTVIGIAMLAFVAGDLFSDNSVVVRLFSGDPNEVGNVNGESISIQEFLNAQSNMRSNPNLSQNQISEQVWNSLVSQKIVKAHAERAGLEVNDDEVWQFLAMQYGMPNADELKAQVGALKTQAQQGVDGAGQAYYNFLNTFDDAKPGLLSQKYMDLIALGITTTAKEAELQQIGNIQNATIDYGFLSYDDLQNRYNVEVTDDEINAYIKKHPKQFEREATVDLSFVYFTSTPSAADEEAVKNEINKYLNGSISHDEVNNITDTIQAFASVINDSAYVAKFSDRPFIESYLTKNDIDQFSSQLPEDYAEFLQNASVGQVGGPFKTGDAYQIVKISKSKEIADSIKSSHILISYAASEAASRNPSITRTREEARALADSLSNVVNASNFVSMVSQFSDDEGSKLKDGSIGWTARNSQSIAPEYLQFLNENNTGEIGLTESRFGFHIIKIDGIKNITGYQIANIVKEINPSQETSDANFSNARNFAQEVQGKSLNEFANLAQQKEYNYNTAEDVTRYYNRSIVDRSSGFSNDKDDDILKWAFSKDTKPGSSNLFTTPQEDQIIVYVSAKRPKGLAAASSVRLEVEPILAQEKMIEEVNKKLGDNPSVNAFVSDFGAERGSSSTAFTSAQIDGKGNEPIVAGAAFGLKVGEASKAIAGNAGVYVIELKSMQKEPEVRDASFLIDQMNQQKSQNMQQKLVPSMIEAADIKDSRMERLDRQVFM